ncbi:unnamed protein product [Thlaspi arvense]|uniref:Uncharacterized protein n=1 Tax=Thlaspi arvense TaxID=13288 RepID=A0AAU9RFU9_THLAR|nr:unnamed protein product [Thlaspi arvense]
MAMTQYMLDQLTDLQRREHALNEANRSLKQRESSIYIVKASLGWGSFVDDALQLLEGNQVNPLQWNPSVQDVGYSQQPAQPQGDGFFHPLECEPTLQIGYECPPEMRKKSCILFSIL